MSTVTEIVDFSAGMNTLISQHLIANNESVNLVNVDIRHGALLSMPNPILIQDLLNGPFFYEYMNKVHSFESWRSNVFWDNKWYWSSSLKTGKMLSDGTELPLGLPTPQTELTVAVEGDGPLEGDLKYTYTFYSTTTGVESAPAPLPLYVKTEGNAVRLTGFEAMPTGVDRYRIYRIGGYLPMFQMVDTITADTYLDELDDTRIDGRVLQTLRNGPPPSGLHNLVELNGRFYGAVGNKIYFSALGNPDSWYISDYFVVRGSIEALASVPAGLLVLGDYATSLLYGTDPSNFRLKVISDQYGCISKESVAYLSDSVIWMSNNHIVMSNGYKIVNVTAFKTEEIKGIVATGAVVENEVYYVSFKPGLFPSDFLYPSEDLFPDTPKGVGQEDQGIITLDFKRGNQLSYKIINFPEIRTLGMVRNNVHLSIGSYDNDPRIVAHPTATPFELKLLNQYDSDLGWATLKYKSKRFIDAGLTTLKQYDKVRLHLRGRFKVQIFLKHDNMVIEQDIDNMDDPKAFVTIGIPNKNNLGYFIQFVIEGEGVISSIQYSWQPRLEPN